jgi:hypothetical protein
MDMGSQNTILSREHGFLAVGFADDEDLKPRESSSAAYAI